MAEYSQSNRPLVVTTPLGPDVLLATGFSGREGLSQLFQFRLEAVAENQADVAFDKLLGQKITVHTVLPGGKKRHFTGICSRILQGGRDDVFTRYSLEIVPQFWLLTRKVQSRIFQHQTVPDILKKVLEGLDVAFELQGAFPLRDYCVQYRESDFAFASRLMEEEGIFYFFKHSDAGSKLVVANSAPSHPDVPEHAKAIYDELAGGSRDDVRIHSWRKIQEIRSGKVTLWDTYFEMPQKHLEAEKTITESVQVGKVAHKLKVAGNDKLELYDYPGGYAEWFDGVDPGGGNKSGDLQKLFQENKRVAEIRMQQEAVNSLRIEGTSNCSQLTAGHKFTLERHFNADGAYVLTTVEHQAAVKGDYRSTDTAALDYKNTFTCIPTTLPFRPQCETPEPMIHGTQTATVVGPPGETIYPDKYARVKVQFHWDREGKKNADSSCWVRVSQAWGGGNWGGMTIPHVGQEVIVAFEEGDPDRPVITGRVYNAEQMPPLGLPGNMTKSVLRDHGDNQIIMEGEAGKQQIVMFSPVSSTFFTIGAPPPGEMPTAASAGSGAGAGPPPPPSPSFKIPGISASTEGDWTLFGKSDWHFELFGHQFDKIQGNSIQHVHGAYIQTVIGVQEETCVGGKTEHVLGGWHNNIDLAGRSDISAPFIFEYAKGWKLERAPKVIEIGSAVKVQKDKEELEKINSAILQYDNVLMNDIKKEVTRIDNCIQSIKDWAVKVAGKLNEVFNEVEQKITKIETNVSGLQKVVAGNMELTSKGDLKITTPVLRLKGSLKMTGDCIVEGDSFSFGSLTAKK